MVQPGAETTCASVTRNCSSFWRFPSSRSPGERFARVPWASAKPSWGGFPQLAQFEEGVMPKVLAVLAASGSFLLVARVIDAGTAGRPPVVKAVGHPAR